jgi:hypothetical protein
MTFWRYWTLRLRMFFYRSKEEKTEFFIYDDDE